LDDFYNLNQNRTNVGAAGLAWEGQALFISQIASNTYADTMYNCFLFMQNVQ
jgi:hypothetical protein